MNRKHFLAAAGTFISYTTLPISATAIAPIIPGSEPFTIPPYLQPGDVIGITSPAGTITLAELQPAMEVLQSWGYTVQVGTTIGKKEFTYGGTDAERAADLQHMLNDKTIKAIMCARGGYGCVRIVDAIDWSVLKKHPKWVIGFSDITVLLNHIHHNLQVATLHSKMCNSFPDSWADAEPVQIAAIGSIQEALVGKSMQYTAQPHLQNKAGTASGILVGGNLKTIESLTGSASDIDTNGKILFVEDTGEYLYSIDRMFWNLKRTGKLSHLKALIVGGFKVKPDDEGEAFGSDVPQIVLEKVKEYSYPVCFDFPVGHQRANFALKCGVKHQLQITNDTVTLNEIV